MCDFIVYILTNRTKTIFTIGITDDLGNTLNEIESPDFEHKAKGIHLIYYKAYPNLKLAKEAKTILKRKSRTKQEMEIRVLNPRIIPLNSLFTTM